MNISRFFVAPLLIFLLLISAYSVMELANRASAMRFVESELVTARSSVATMLDGEGRAMAEAATVSIKTDEKTLIRTSQRLETLQFSGASEPGGTVYLLMKELFRLRQASTNDAVKRDAQRSISVLEQELALIETGRQTLQAVNLQPASSLSQLETQLRTASSQIPVINEPQNPTESIMRGIDMQFLSMLREMDEDSFELASAGDGIESLNQGILNAVEQLDSRQNQISELSSSAQARLDEIEQSRSSEGVSQERPGWTGPMFFISTLPSDLILIIAVVSAAGVGALFLGLHRPNENLFASIVKGFIAGFVALLVMKGGTLLFTVDSDFALDNSNPFSAAFLGVVAGLFTDRAFDTLEGLVKERLANDRSDPDRQVDREQRAGGFG